MMRPAPTPARPLPTSLAREPASPRRAAPVKSRDRLERRRRLLWWSALPALLVLCLSAKVISVGILADTAARSFAAGDAGAVAEAAAGLRIVNFVELHKAPFTEGDGLFLAGDFAAARQRFEEALSLAGTADECVVRVNLALTIERLGDAQAKAGDPTAAARLFAEGVAVVEAAPEGCFETAGEAGKEAGPENGAGEKLHQAAERLQQKADAAAADKASPQPSEQPGQDEVPADPGQQSQLEQLRDSAKKAQSERNSGQERDEYLRDDDFGPGVGRPW
ncbi:tetratricopeptide repeat protein [Pseudarthrobacter sp. AB1]|uniref:tetratricopeptide repeat protein n=1 Tax=Pseudarthrobacter sp. AB1 TaxID=2138309 RepID=UPI001D05238D|nr:tetratricopeptide repeat protein [Pseudarthrobacter sp. AB1]